MKKKPKNKSLCKHEFCPDCGICHFCEMADESNPSIQARTPRRVSQEESEAFEEKVTSGEITIVDKCDIHSGIGRLIFATDIEKFIPIEAKSEAELKGKSELVELTLSKARSALPKVVTREKKKQSAKGGKGGTGKAKSGIAPFIYCIIKLGVKPTAEAVQDFIRAFEEANEKPEVEPLSGAEEKIIDIAGQANASLSKPLDLRPGRLYLDENGENDNPKIVYHLKGGKKTLSIGNHHLRTYILKRL